MGTLIPTACLFAAECSRSEFKGLLRHCWRQLVQALAKMELRVSPRLLDSLAAAALLKISEFNPQVCTRA